MMKILIVDDKEENRYLLEALLNGTGYKTITAKNGAEALGFANKDVPDLIISDILMPVMDGYSLCRECKKSDKLNKIPFVFYTATYTDPKDEEFALSLGADSFILKPQDPDVFLKEIKKFLNKEAETGSVSGQPELPPETIILKEYNQTLIRKLEDKMMQTEKSERELKKTVKELENNLEKRKIAEEGLREQDFFLTSVIENIPDMIFIKNADDLKYVKINKAGEELLGFKREEIIGKGDREIFPAEQAASFEKSDREVLESGTPKNIPEEYIDTRNGRRILHTKKLFLCDNNGRPTHLLGISEDITERKKALMDLEESEKKYRALISQSPDGIFIVDLDGNFLSVNKTMCDQLHYSEEEFYSMKITDIIPPELIPQFKGRLAKILAGETITEPLEYEVSGKLGESIYVEVLSAPYYRENELKGFQGIARNITERKIAEKQITLLAHSIKSVTECISITDRNDNIIFVNEAFLKTYGYSEDELIGKPISIVQYHERGTGEKIKNIKADTDGTVWKGEAINVRKDGSLFPVALSTSIVKDGSGSPVALICVAADITEMKKNREELIRAKDKAEEMNKLKSYFFANMSHELRTPFVGIMSGAEILGDMIKDSEPKELVEIIYQSARRLTETLNKILNLSKLEFEKPEMNYAAVDIKAIIDGVWKLFKKTADKNNIELVNNSGEDPLFILSDAAVIRVIVENLVSNAFKYTDKGKIEIGLEKIGAKDGMYVRMKISDTGVGIPDDKKKLIWNEFRQGSEGFDRHFEGTGLGLTITKKYVELLHGKISVESSVGNGTTFEVVLPVGSFQRKDIEKSEGPETKKSNTETTTDKKERIKRLLYIEDDANALQLVSIFLRKYYLVEIAEDAESALKKLEHENFDAFLIDIGLGKGMNGIDLMSYIKNKTDYKDAPFIAVTAYAAEKDRKEFISKGFTHYISKPFERNTLLKLIEEVFSNN